MLSLEKVYLESKSVYQSFFPLCLNLTLFLAPPVFLFMIIIFINYIIFFTDMV